MEGKRGNKMNTNEILRGLRYEQKKRENDFVGTCQTNISAMCKDAADCIESLQAKQQGIWERMENAYGELEGFMCECGNQSNYAAPHCPNCGKKMSAGEKKD